jgi:hypothetical protein
MGDKKPGEMSLYLFIFHFYTYNSITHIVQFRRHSGDARISSEDV